VPWMSFLAGRARAKALLQKRAFRNAPDLDQTEALAVA
jgi:hypothetical protein